MYGVNHIVSCDMFEYEKTDFNIKIFDIDMDRRNLNSVISQHIYCHYTDIYEYECDKHDLISKRNSRI